MKIKSIVKTFMAVSLLTVALPLHGVSAKTVNNDISVSLHNYVKNKSQLSLNVTGTYNLLGDKGVPIDEWFLHVENRYCCRKENVEFASRE